jgi:hypothetical protein
VPDLREAGRLTAPARARNTPAESRSPGVASAEGGYRDAMSIFGRFLGKAENAAARGSRATSRGRAAKGKSTTMRARGTTGRGTTGRGTTGRGTTGRGTSGRGTTGRGRKTTSSGGLNRLLGSLTGRR